MSATKTTSRSAQIGQTIAPINAPRRAYSKLHHVSSLTDPSVRIIYEYTAHIIGKLMYTPLRQILTIFSIYLCKLSVIKHPMYSKFAITSQL